MKTSFKTTTLIAAIGMMVYTIYGLTRYAIHEFWPIPYHYDLWYDIIERIILDILPISLIFAGVGLWNYCPSNNESQSFRIFTICLFIALIGTLLFSPLYTYSIVGLEYIFPPIFWRAIILISGIVWLFMFRRQPLEETSPRSYRVTLILAMLLLALPMVLEAISGISLLCGRDIVLGLNSGAIKSWMRWIAPSLVFVHFVFPHIKVINATRNSHCIPDSFDESTFHRNRAITLVVVGVAIVSFIVAFVSYTMSYHLLYRNLYLFQILRSVAAIAGCIAGVTTIISWIMLSIMAFHYLPNPRGYKIYNIVCQFVTWGSLVPAIFAPSNFDEIFGVIFLIFFGAFFLTTTIRVISYSLPK